MSSKQPIGVDARADGLAANELQLLADMNLELAGRYERDATCLEDKEERRIALTLSKWRQLRGQFFRQLSAEAERAEAAHIEWARACFVPGVNHQSRHAQAN